jgi:membrane protein
LLAAIPFILLLFAGLARLLQGIAGTGPIDPQQLFERFLPPHAQGDGDPFKTVEIILGRITQIGQSLTIVALPLFIWFSTRLFAGMRTSLNAIYDVSLRPSKKNFLLQYVLGKLRDLGMVLMTLVLFLCNTILTTGFTILHSVRTGDTGSGPRPPTFSERWGSEALGFGFLLVLFYILYRYASMRRVTWQAALVAAAFMAVAFEIARRLFSLYLRGATGYGTGSADASTGAVILFVVWLYYSALVFLLGGVVAETWELRALQRIQRGIV